MDGTVNLGQVPGEDGVWELNYIESFANYVVPTPGYRSTNSRRHGRGSAGELQVPFLPWTAAVYLDETSAMRTISTEGLAALVRTGNSRN